MALNADEGDEIRLVNEEGEVVDSSTVGDDDGPLETESAQARDDDAGSRGFRTVEEINEGEPAGSIPVDDDDGGGGGSSPDPEPAPEKVDLTDPGEVLDKVGDNLGKNAQASLRRADKFGRSLQEVSTFSQEAAEDALVETAQETQETLEEQEERLENIETEQVKIGGEVKQKSKVLDNIEQQQRQAEKQTETIKTFREALDKEENQQAQINDAKQNPNIKVKEVGDQTKLSLVEGGETVKQETVKNQNRGQTLKESLSPVDRRLMETQREITKKNREKPEIQQQIQEEQLFGQIIEPETKEQIIQEEKDTQKTGNQPKPIPEITGETREEQLDQMLNVADKRDDVTLTQNKKDEFVLQQQITRQVEQEPSTETQAARGIFNTANEKGVLGSFTGVDEETLAQASAADIPVSDRASLLLMGQFDEAQNVGAEVATDITQDLPGGQTVLSTETGTDIIKGIGEAGGQIASSPMFLTSAGLQLPDAARESAEQNVEFLQGEQSLEEFVDPTDDPAFIGGRELAEDFAEEPVRFTVREGLSLAAPAAIGSGTGTAKATTTKAKNTFQTLSKNTKETLGSIDTKMQDLNTELGLGTRKGQANVFGTDTQTGPGTKPGPRFNQQVTVPDTTPGPRPQVPDIGTKTQTDTKTTPNTNGQNIALQGFLAGSASNARPSVETGSSPRTDTLTQPGIESTGINEALTGVERGTRTNTGIGTRTGVRTGTNTSSITSAITKTAIRNPTKTRTTPKLRNPPKLRVGFPRGGDDDRSGLNPFVGGDEEPDQDARFAPSLDSLVTGRTVEEDEFDTEQTFSGLESRPIVVDDDDDSDDDELSVFF